MPAFNSTCLGKWSCVTNCTSHKDWATKDNSILVEPSGLIEPYDGAFFSKGLDYNQGTVYNISTDSMKEAMMESVVRYKTTPTNENGIKLGKELTYTKSVASILELMK